MKTEYNDDDLRKEAPKLFGMDKKNPFEVPDGFFDTFSSKVQDKIAAEKKKTIWSVIFETVIKPKIAIPVLASLCLVAVGIKIMYRPPTVINYNETAITYNDLSQSDYLTDIDESILMDALNTATNKSNTSSKTEIENYLIENNIDVNDLANELN
jgi:hypothetical protein